MQFINFYYVNCLGICDRWIKNNPYIYPWTITAVGCISIIYVLDKQLKVPLGFLSDWCHALPLYSMGLGWVAVAIAAAALTSVLYAFKKR